MRRPFAIVGFFLLLPGVASAQVDPASLPARDAHERFLVACDPHVDSARAQARLGKNNPLEVGILPVEVFLRNDTGVPIRVDLESIRLLVAAPDRPRQRLEPLALEDVIDRILNKDGPPDITATRTRLPRRSTAGRSKKWKELDAKLRPLSLEMDVVPPSATVRGFLFFDLAHHYELLLYSRLYVPDLKFMTTNQPLMYFEVDLARAAPH